MNSHQGSEERVQRGKGVYIEFCVYRTFYGIAVKKPDFYRLTTLPLGARQPLFPETVSSVFFISTLHILELGTEIFSTLITILDILFSVQSQEL